MRRGLPFGAIPSTLRGDDLRPRPPDAVWQLHLQFVVQADAILGAGAAAVQFRTVNLKHGVQKQPEYLAINRYGQVPALRHNGLTIVQSNVILDYLARTTGHFAGATEQHRWWAREWLSWEADNITNVAKVRHYSRFRRVDAAVMDYFRPLALAAVGFVDQALQGRQWLVGEAPSIADIGCWGRMVFMAEGGLDIAAWPNVQAWSRRLAALPGFALPYDLIPSKDREFDPCA